MGEGHVTWGGACYVGEGHVYIGRGVLCGGGACYVGEGRVMWGRGVLCGGGACYVGEGHVTWGQNEWLGCYWDLVEWPYYRGGLFREVKMNG